MDFEPKRLKFDIFSLCCLVVTSRESGWIISQIQLEWGRSSRIFLEGPVNMTHKLKGLYPLCFAGVRSIH